MRNIFLQKSYTNCSGETIPKRFSKKSKMIYSLFLLYAKLRAIEIYRNKAADHLLLPQITFFKKTKRGLGLVSLPHFLHACWRKIFLM